MLQDKLGDEEYNEQLKTLKEKSKQQKDERLREERMRGGGGMGGGPGSGYGGRGGPQGISLFLHAQFSHPVAFAPSSRFVASIFAPC